MANLPLYVDASKFSFTVASSASEKLDEHKRQRMDKKNGLPLYVVQLFALFEGGGAVLDVTLATTQPPKLAPGQAVSTQGLQAVPWVRGSNAQVSYRAENIVAASGPGSASSSKN